MQIALARFANPAIVGNMMSESEIPNDLEGCRAFIRAQATTISEQAIANAEQSALLAAQSKQLEELGLELEKLRKLLSHFVNGHRSEKRIITGPDQHWLPFENSEEFQAARAEAEAQAEAIVQTYSVERKAQSKKPRDESLPSHLRREEQIINGNAAQKTCPTHGERTIIGYDTTETLVYQRPELHVLVKKYPKYACPGIRTAESLHRSGRHRWSKGIATTPAWPRQSLRPSGFSTCRSTGNRMCMRGAVGRLAVRRC